ncbi:MAG: SusF/SusE family outer membrane protein [Sphingobacteriia bacterium]|nr:SusF/SusE family outer membrane protein [Sphingobacteriia bacterium]
MEKRSFKWFLRAVSMLLLVAVVLVSCKDDDDDDPNPPVVVEDGFYIVGAGTALTDYDIKGLLKPTRNEVTQEERASLLEIYVAVKTGADGFNIMQVAGATKTSWGPGADFAVVGEADRIADEPKLDFWRGSLAQTETKFTVPEDGLYHVVIDTEVGKVVVVPVKYWGLIGAATPGGWSDDTQMPSKGFDLNTITFEVNDVTMTKADFKFRYSEGWKVVIDDNVDLGGGVMGVRVNTNFGGAVNALVPGGDNISNEEGGIYTAKMVWTLGSAYAATTEKTGDLQVIDYTDTEIGLVGNGLVVNGVPHNWTETIMLSTPTVENETNYTWTYESVEVQPDSSGFKFREGQDWNGISIGYPQVTMAGLAADDFETNGDGNFLPKVAGVYDIELFIDAVTEEYTVTVNEAGAAPELYVLGDATLAGWDNTIALPMTGTGGIYTITTELAGTGTMLKFIEVLGQWAPQYGTDANGTSSGGNLVYRPDENTPDPAAIPSPDVAGTYVITANINDLTYTIVAAK